METELAERNLTARNLAPQPSDAKQPNFLIRTRNQLIYKAIHHCYKFHESLPQRLVYSRLGTREMYFDRRFHAFILLPKLGDQSHFSIRLFMEGTKIKIIRNKDKKKNTSQIQVLSKEALKIE